MDARDITFAAPGGVQSCRAADREKLGAHALLLQLAKQIVEADAVAPDHHEVGQLQVAAEKLNVDEGARLDDLLVPADRREAVGAAERRDAAGPLSHRIGGERRSGRLVRSLDQPDQQILGAADLAVDLDRQSGRHHGPLLGAPTGQQPKHRRDELVKRENRRRRKAGEHDNRTAASRRQADRLARLERDAVSDDSGIAQFGDDAIRQIARALARAAGEQHDIGKLERVPNRFPQGGHIVGGNPQPFRLAAELAHGIGEHLGVRVVDLCRLHRLAGSDDLVAGRENGDDRLSPDFDGSDADRGQHAGIPAGQELTPAEHGLAAGDVGSGKRHPASRRDRSGDPQLAAVGLGVLDHHDGIGAARNHSSGGN